MLQISGNVVCFVDLEVDLETCEKYLLQLNWKTPFSLNSEDADEQSICLLFSSASSGVQATATLLRAWLTTPSTPFSSVLLVLRSGVKYASVSSHSTSTIFTEFKFVRKSKMESSESKAEIVQKASLWKFLSGFTIGAAWKKMKSVFAR